MFTPKEYLEQISAAMNGVEADIENIVSTLSTAKKEGDRVWVLGNGGSLAIAQHFAQDLVKLCSVKAHALNCPSLITAHMNDDGFEYGFFNPIDKLASEWDIVLILSCSGKSRNYIEFVSGFPAKRMILSVVGTDGGFLKEKSDVCVHIKSDDYQICETAFCVVCDLVVKELIEAE